jgi:hypothetical protein
MYFLSPPLLTSLILYLVSIITINEDGIRDFWYTAQCSLVGIDRRLRDAIIKAIRVFIIIALMMEAVRTSETWVYSIETAWGCTQEGSNLHMCRRENLKSHLVKRSHYEALHCVISASYYFIYLTSTYFPQHSCSEIFLIRGLPLRRETKFHARTRQWVKL